ncbi:leucine-rich repeat domain-containing protein [Cellulomonas cellasea]|uniref:leucine-rich repeat domain-containing protein n=1 Tax=Cellulomonas cellasea TaxID=43670 RepID=UPI0025A3AE91|nr:leucine-rich repeat domain-containing protein [Cellulomonas cellasea]MDM8083722.1 leucine-rich repeat domain-containing protein [Cellulomonas cellasea]
MRRRQWVWFAIAAIVGAAALPVSAPLLGSSASRPLGVLVLVLGLAPVLLLTASEADRRRRGVALALAGSALAVAGLVLAAELRFLSLRLATIHWRIFVVSGYGLAPWGWVLAGAGLALAGVAMARARSGRRRGLVVASVVLLVVTCAFFAMSSLLNAWRTLRLVPSMSPLASTDLLRGIALLAAGALLAAVAFHRTWLQWPTVSEPGAAPVRPRPRWVARTAAALLGVALAAGGAGGWYQWGPRIVLAEVFPDPRLAACVAQSTGAAGVTAKVSRAALSQVRSLACDVDTADSQEPGATSPRVTSLIGIESLRNLATLDLSEHDVSDLTPLSDLNSLSVLKLTHNQVTDLEPLRGLPLQDVGLSDNQIRDLGPLASAPGIRHLGLARNEVVDLAPLAALTRLVTLDVSGNAIVDVSPLAGLSELNRLTVSANRVADPAPLGGLPALVMLDIADNRIDDAARFTGFSALDELWLGGNPVPDLTPLTELPALLGVDLEGAHPSPAGVELLRAQGVHVGGLA